jgi:hypothetical protein
LLVEMDEVVDVGPFHEVEFPQLEERSVHFYFFFTLDNEKLGHLGMEASEVEKVEKVYFFVENATVYILGLVQLTEVRLQWVYNDFL